MKHRWEWAMAGVALAALSTFAVAGAGAAVCEDPESPDCNDKVSWSNGSDIDLAITTSGVQIARLVMGGPGGGETPACQKAVLTAEGSDCDEWACCGQCPGNESGEMQDMLMFQWEIISGPEGGGSLEVSGGQGNEATFTATQEGSYYIRCRADDMGHYDECAEVMVSDEPAFAGINIVVFPWEEGGVPSLDDVPQIDVGIPPDVVWQDLPGWGVIVDPGSHIRVKIDDFTDPDYCPVCPDHYDCGPCDIEFPMGGGITFTLLSMDLEDLQPGENINEVADDDVRWNRLIEDYVACELEFWTPCSEVVFRVIMYADDCGAAYDDDPVTERGHLWVCSNCAGG